MIALSSGKCYRWCKRLGVFCLRLVQLSACRFAELQGVPLLKALQIQLPRLCSLPLRTQVELFGGATMRRRCLAVHSCCGTFRRRGMGRTVGWPPGSLPCCELENSAFRTSWACQGIIGTVHPHPRHIQIPSFIMFHLYDLYEHDEIYRDTVQIR